MTEVVSQDDLAAADAADEAPIEIPEGSPQSPLDLLKGKRAAAQKRLHIDLAVPRWEDVLGKSIWVRYGPANVALWSASQQRRESQHLAAKKKGQPGDPDWAIKANADLLVDACQGVYFLEPGEQPPHDQELPADLPKFSDPELAEALDIQPGNAVRTALGLYQTGADLLMASNALLGWSGEASKEADEAFLGS